MKIAKIRVFWKPSTLIDIVQYKILIINNNTGEIISEKVVSFAESAITIEIPIEISIVAHVFANDGFFDEAPVSIPYTVGNPSIQNSEIGI